MLKTNERLEAWMNKRFFSRENLLRTGMSFFLIAASLSLANVLLLPYARTFHGYAGLPAALCAAAAFAGYLWLGRRLKAADEARLEHLRNIAVPAYMAALFIVQVIMGYLLEYVPAGDNLMLYNGSELLAREGSFQSVPDFGLYLARFSNQWGFLVLLTYFWKLMLFFGVQSLMLPAAILQAALYTLGMRSCLRIARRMRGVRSELMLLAMLVTCLPLYLAAAVVYTDTFSLPFILIGMDLALCTAGEESRGKQLLYALLTGIVLLFGAQIKMTALIVLIAALIVWALKLKIVRAALCGVICTVIVAGGTLAFQQTVVGTIIDPDVHAQQKTPLIHWVMMSIPTGNYPYGTYTGDYGPTWEMMDAGASHEEIMDSIYTRMKDRIYTLRYPNRLLAALFRKNSVYIGDGTFGMTEMLDDTPVRENAVSSFVLAGRPHYGLYSAVCTGVFMAQLALAAAGCLRDIRKKDTRAAMLYIALFGSMLFLLLWEPRSRYLFGYVPLFLIAAAIAAAEPDRAR